MATDRGKFICQSQSLNLFVESPNYKLLSSMHFYGWKKGLKTGMYYLRTRQGSKAIQFTVEPEKYVSHVQHRLLRYYLIYFIKDAYFILNNLYRDIFFFWW